eukprot:scaffold6070_cov295-Pinguiococcus_pyrenoidosus.AAC.2
MQGGTRQACCGRAFCSGTMNAVSFYVPFTRDVSFAHKIRQSQPCLHLRWSGPLTKPHLSNSLEPLCLSRAGSILPGHGHGHLDHVTDTVSAA